MIFRLEKQYLVYDFYYSSTFVILRDILDKRTSKVYAFIDLPLIK